MLDISWIESLAHMTDLELKTELKKQPLFIQEIFSQNDISQYNNLFEVSGPIAYKNTVFQI